MRMCVVIFIIFLGVVLVGCGGGGGGGGPADTVSPAPPQITGGVTPNATVSGTIFLSATATDNSGTVRRMQFFVSSSPETLVCSDDVAKPSGSTFSCSWNTRTHPNGAYTLQAQAVDPSGNSSRSSPIPFTINNTNQAPSITAGPVATPAIINEGSTTSLSVTATDPDGDVLAYQWEQQSPATPLGQFANSTSNNTVWTAPQVSQDTSFVLRVTVSDGKGGTAQATVAVTVSDAPSNLSAWTVMVYMVADNNLEDDGVGDLNEMLAAGSNTDVNVVVQADRHPQHSNSGVGGISNWTTTKRLKVNNGSLQELADLGELNMGDPAVLRDFVEWTIQNFPAQKYALVLWDHGASWPGFGGDESNGSDMLSLAEMEQALSAALPLLGGGRFELIGFDACLMATLEVAYSLMGVGNFLVASQELEPGHGWDYTGTLQNLKANTAMDGNALGRVIADTYKAHAEAIAQQRRQNGQTYNEERTITLSVVDLTKIATFASSVSQFASLLKGKVDQETLTNRPISLIVGDGRNLSQDYARQGDRVDESFFVMDLQDFVAYIQQNSPDTQVRDSASEVLNQFAQTVTYRVAGADRAKSDGLSIHFPTVLSNGNYDFTNGYRPLRFPQETQWDDFLLSYLTLNGSDTEAPTFAVDTTIVNSGPGFTLLGAQLGSTDLRDVGAYIAALDQAGNTIFLGYWPLEPDQDNAVYFIWNGRWWGLCNALIQCAYLPATILGEIDPGKILSATDVVYQPAGSASGFEDALLWSYDFATGTGIVYGVWAGVDASGSASREILPLADGDFLAPYYLAVDAQGQESYVLGPTLEVRNPMTVAPFVLPGGLLYLVGFFAADYNGNDAVSTPLVCDNTGACTQVSPRPAGFAPAEQGVGTLIHIPRRLPGGILPGDADEQARTAVLRMSEATPNQQSESGVTEGKAGETG